MKSVIIPPCESCGFWLFFGCDKLEEVTFLGAKIELAHYWDSVLGGSDYIIYGYEDSTIKQHYEWYRDWYEEHNIKFVILEQKQQEQQEQGEKQSENPEEGKTTDNGTTKGEETTKETGNQSQEISNSGENAQLADKIIPCAGLEIGLGIFIIVATTLSIIFFVKYKKYRNM